jgi:hypothetical protein
MKLRYGWAPLALALTLAPGSGVWSAPSSGRQVVLPADSVLKVKLDNTIGSDRSKKGDKFIATVEDRELPSGTIVRGTVLSVTPATKQQAGAIGMDFRTLELPDGRRVAIDGWPTGLDSKSVKTASNGRLVATASSKKNTTKYVGYGAAGGLLLGSLLGSNVKGALLGGAAGYLLGRNKDKKSRNRDVVLKEGSTMGVRLDRRVALASVR